MTYNDRQQVINNINGNYMTYKPEEGVSHVDQYNCPCGDIVNQTEWVEEFDLCNVCHAQLLEMMKSMKSSHS